MLDCIDDEAAGGFGGLLSRWRAEEHPNTDDLLAAVLPLIRQTAELHASGCIAPLDGVGALRVSRGCLGLPDGEASPPRTEAAALAQAEEDPARLAWKPGYTAWEQRLGHHDPLSDIFVLGLILASLAARLDLSDADDLRQFIRWRTDLSRLNPRLHPAAARIIARMTEPDRRRRPGDLEQIANALAHYRAQEVEAPGPDALTAPEAGPAGPEAAETGPEPRPLDRAALRQAVHGQLRDRLFEINRRNRLIYFRETRAAVNLTAGSLPAAADAAATIRPEQIFCCNEALCREFRRGIELARWLRPDDHPRLAAALDRIRLDAERDAREYGFSQLRLAAAFLRWSNLKDAPQDRIASPLVLLPARLTKRKAVKDIFRLDVDPAEAEVNPALRHHLRVLYDIRLPDRIDMSSLDGLRALHADLAAQLGRSAGEVTLTLAEAPRLPAADRATEAGESGAGAEVRVPATGGEAGGGGRAWVIDLCAVTLANFNYRKMTLVRDYAELGSRAWAHRNFDRLFSEEARPSFASDGATSAADHLVLPADPSQAEAVARAAAGESYVIQGPPGTGKSQTITNLIADAAARGKGVLFVCEKRAALDVVHHRLKQAGLGEACALIHDSQGDKKTFIEEVKAIYESWLDRAPGEEAAKRRAALLKEIGARMDELARFSAAMTAAVEADGPTLRDLLEERLRRGGRAPRLSAALKGALPAWSSLQAARPLLERLQDALASAGVDGALARSPLRLLRGDAASAAGAADRIERAARRGRPLVTEAAPAAASLAAFLGRETVTWSDALAAAGFCRALEPLAAADRLVLLDPDSPEARRLAAALERLAALQAKAANAREAARGWPDDVDAEDLGRLIDAARQWEGKAWAFVSGDWRRARGLMRAHYRGGEAKVSLALRLLLERQRAQAHCDEAQAAIEKTFGFEPETLTTTDIQATLRRVWAGGADLSEAERDVVKACLQREGAATAALRTARLAPALRRAEDELQPILLGHGRLAPEAIAAGLDALAAHAGLIPELGDLLAELDGAGPELSQALRLIDLPPAQIEMAALDAAIDRVLKRNRALERFDGARLEDIVRRIQELQGQLRQVNARFAVAACHKGFHDAIARSNEPLAKATLIEREWRLGFKRGRKVLENEFQKSRAFKSIRELFSGEAGPVLRRLKPVWLMSPLSVADILPLEETLFDVVIFDEASQIPLEDAIPSLYRSQQMIVVGDEMQLPPSSFFAAQSGGEEEDGAPGLFVYDLNADSFLSRASASLPRTLLAWHYRSRHEALITFCNKAFYKGQLQTIPSAAELPRREPIRVTRPEDAEVFAARALEQPLSFHKMERSPYGSQRNPGEAAYIARLTREILKAGRGLSLGIVAFSQAQQSQIESAIEELAATDGEFRALLDAEEERQDDGQYVGLFVKNLENVQGDERDVIILSVCYGPDARGRMAMNFGPINQNGGEKRLNVIFSRAKRHMMVVASIEGGRIANAWNYGANALRKYLIYAQAAAEGRAADMESALAEFAARDGRRDGDAPGQAAADQIAQALQAKGLVTARNLGRSDLKCHVAVRRPEDERFRVAVQVDDEAHYRNGDLGARYVTPPAILTAFGWEVVTVLAKDWRADPKGVVERIVGRV